MRSENSLPSNSRKEALLLIILLSSCVETLDIQSIGFEDSLVIEGFISTEMKRHQVTLSHTSQLNKKEFIGETGAQVSIKDQNDNIIQLKEEKPGRYLTPKTAGVIGNSYTLNVVTSKDKQYISSQVKLLSTPAINDIRANFIADVSADPGKGKIQILLDTEDPTNEAKFYRWEFKETYEIRTPYPSAFIWLGGNNVVFRDISIGQCWASDSSNSILLHSTVGLTESKVRSALIQTIPGSSETMRVIYSILVSQYVLSQEAYRYWNKLKDLNENQGSLSDHQPGAVRGNIRSLSDDEIVLGYFDACAITQKRAFFRPDDFLDAGYRRPKFLSSCETIPPVDVPVEEIGAFYAANEGTDLIIWETSSGILHLRPRYCCDCTNLGSNIKPSFWQ
jgi:hypothetical protein